MESSTDLLVKNLGLLLGFIKGDKEDVVSEIIDVFFSNGYIDAFMRLLDEAGLDKRAFAKEICLAAARNNYRELFDEFFGYLSNGDKVEVLADVIDDMLLGEDFVTPYAKQVLETAGNIDTSDRDQVRGFALIYSFLGDFTRARFLGNTFCSLVEAESETADMLSFYDKVDCLNLIFHSGDKERALKYFEKLSASIKADSEFEPIVIMLIDVLSKHKDFVRAFSLLDRVGGVNFVTALSIIMDHANRFDRRDIIDDAIRIADEKIVDPLLKVIFSLYVRKYGSNEWQGFFYNNIPSIDESMNMDLFVDFMESLADEDYLDMLETINSHSIYWGDIVDKLTTSTLKYAYAMVVSGRVENGIRILDEYLNTKVLSEEHRGAEDFVLYYAKAHIKGYKHHREKMLRLDYDRKLLDKLVVSKKEFFLSAEIRDLLDQITDEKLKIKAIERIVEEEFVRNRCVAIEKISRTFMLQTAYIDSILVNVAKRLLFENKSVVDAVTCLEKISDDEEKLHAFLNLTHRSALMMNRDALPTLLKKVITLKSKLQDKINVDPVEDVKIRADLAVVFKFSGKEAESNQSLEEALSLISAIKPSEQYDFSYYKQLAEGYGYLAATYYVLGRVESDELLNDALKNLNYLPLKMKYPIITKLLIWFSLAGWMPVVFKILQTKELKPLISFIGTLLMEIYAAKGLIEDAKNEISLLVDDREKRLSLMIRLARQLARGGQVDESINLIRESILPLTNSLDDYTATIYRLQLAEIYAIIGEKEEAEKILDAAINLMDSVDDRGIKDELLSYIVPVKYFVLSY